MTTVKKVGMTADMYEDVPHSEVADIPGKECE